LLLVLALKPKQECRGSRRRRRAIPHEAWLYTSREPGGRRSDSSTDPQGYKL